MPKKPPSNLNVDIAVRLRILQDEMGLNDERMGELVGVGRTTWTNWVNLENYPDVEAMLRLCRVGHVDMNWLYEGDLRGLALGLAIRLTARLHGIDPDEASAEVLAVPAPGRERVAAILGKAARHMPS